VRILLPYRLLLALPVSFSVSVPFPSANMEPFIGSMASFQRWDSFFFFLSGFYFVLRTLLRLLKSFH
jgi:hypothetical protein